jgi:septal ring factor EnvC (AmiA/AmiB activator)
VIGLRLAIAVAALFGLSAPALAQAAVDDVVAAVSALDEAHALVEDISAAEDQMAVLTKAVLSFEIALAALREAGRRVQLLHRAELAELRAASGDLSQLLAALQAAGDPDRPQQLLHPQGPAASARAAMLMAAVLPVLRAKSDAVGARVELVAALEYANFQAQAQLTRGHEAARVARIALARAAKDKTGSGADTGEFVEVLNALTEAGADLEEFVLALAESRRAQELGLAPEFSDKLGNLPPPVSGQVLRGFEEPDTHGVTRPGVVFATRPAALLTAPWPSTLRHKGHLTGYGNVMILEMAPGYLLIMTGMNEMFGNTGEVFDAGAALGLMGAADDVTNGDRHDEGATLSQTLYVETRRNGIPMDPSLWLALDKERN